MKKFISGLIVGALLSGTVGFAASELSAIKSTYSTIVNEKQVNQNVVTINGKYYADMKQMASNLGFKYSVDSKENKIKLERLLPPDIITFSNVKVSADSMFTIVHAEAKNNDILIHTFNCKVTFYDSAKNIIGTANGGASNVVPGEVAIVSALSVGDFTGAASYEIEITNLK